MVLLGFSFIVFSLSNLPWLGGCNFHEILPHDEKTGNEKKNWQIDNFKDVLSDTGVFDMGLEGPEFIWKGPKNDSDYIRADQD